MSDSIEKYGRRKLREILDMHKESTELMTAKEFDELTREERERLRAIIKRLMKIAGISFEELEQLASDTVVSSERTMAQLERLLGDSDDE